MCACVVWALVVVGRMFLHVYVRLWCGVVCRSRRLFLFYCARQVGQDWALGNG